MVNGDRRRHASQGVETSVGGWRVTGVGNVQVDNALRLERKWGVCDTVRCYNK